MILLISIFSMWFIFALISSYIVIGILLYVVKLIRRKKSPAAGLIVREE